MVAKIGIPILLLVALAVGAIKFWPSIQDKFGLGAGSREEPIPTSLPTSPIDPAGSDDPSGFEYTDEPSTPPNPEPIIPVPETRFQPEPEPEPVIDPPPAPLPTVVENEGVSAEGDPEAMEQQARAVLDQALAANTVDELAKHVLTPERVRPLMEAYYGERSPALKSTSIIYETAVELPDTKHRNHTFFIATEKQPMRFPIAIEETDDGPKLDWETFIELHDDLLGEFLASPKSDRKAFRAILVRSHFFGSEVPRLGSKDCFRVSTPIAGSEGYAFVDKDSKAARSCDAFEWDRVCFPIVRLQWVTPENSKPYLEITEVIQTSWRANHSAESN